MNIINELEISEYNYKINKTLIDYNLNVINSDEELKNSIIFYKNLNNKNIYSTIIGFIESNIINDKVSDIIKKKTTDENKFNISDYVIFADDYPNVVTEKFGESFFAKREENHLALLKETSKEPSVKERDESLSAFIEEASKN